ncbi:hypothetical protein [Polyangium sp. 6x1]|uniref:hypothetical protein n=1 Tax=Polyangium sp. 6x1 TaxID=3042689 RepID=UPI002482763C|nr:hypothetical protein [Polyangium sp. 6x1]MDI1446272.1 hypothetical protein [Polyangium sp. 6x1]
MKRIIGMAFIVALAGCLGGVKIYRSLSEPGAMKTCDANTRFRVEAKGADADEAKRKAEAGIRESVKQNKSCGAYIFNEGSGTTLEGTTNHVADYQLCDCD